MNAAVAVCMLVCHAGHSRGTLFSCRPVAAAGVASGGSRALAVPRCPAVHLSLASSGPVDYHESLVNLAQVRPNAAEFRKGPHLTFAHKLGANSTLSIVLAGRFQRGTGSRV